MECRQCGCQHCPVTGTREHEVSFRGKRRKIIRRYRKCRYCGLSFSTVESYETDNKGEPETPDIPKRPEPPKFNLLGGDIPSEQEKPIVPPPNPFVINSKKDTPNVQELPSDRTRRPPYPPKRKG